MFFLQKMHKDGNTKENDAANDEAEQLENIIRAVLEKMKNWGGGGVDHNWGDSPLLGQL